MISRKDLEHLAKVYERERTDRVDRFGGGWATIYT